MLRLIGLLGFSLLLSGCASEKRSQSPEARIEQEQRMRNFLNGSSPRNMNQQSKATPEFTKQFSLPSPAKKAPAQEAPTAGDAEHFEPGRD